MPAHKQPSVMIDSGAIEPDYPLREVPEAKWSFLVSARRSFIARNLNYDCRCLVRFVREADAMWQALGYQSADDMIASGYDLEPEEIRLAVRWLELNEPESAIGLPEVQSKAQQMAADETVKPMPKHAEAMAVVSADQPRAEDGTFGKREQPSGSIATARRQERGAEYLVKRLKRDAPEIAEALARGEYPSARAAGIVKVPTPLDRLRKAWQQASDQDRAALLGDLDQADLARLGLRRTPGG